MLPHQMGKIMTTKSARCSALLLADEIGAEAAGLARVQLLGLVVEAFGIGDGCEVVPAGDRIEALRRRGRTPRRCDRRLLNACTAVSFNAAVKDVGLGMSVDDRDNSLNA